MSEDKAIPKGPISNAKKVKLLSQSAVPIHRGASASGVIPAPFKSWMTALRLLWIYIETVLSKMMTIEEHHPKVGYAEGFARTLTYAAYGRDPKSLLYINTSWSTAKAFIASTKEEILAHSNQDHPVIKRGIGFFDGKDAAIRLLYNPTGDKVDPEKYLNTLFKQQARLYGIEEHVIPKLEYYTDEQIIQMAEK